MDSDLKAAFSNIENLTGQNVAFQEQVEVYQQTVETLNNLNKDLSQQLNNKSKENEDLNWALSVAGSTNEQSRKTIAELNGKIKDFEGELLVRDLREAELNKKLKETLHTLEQEEKRMAMLTSMCDGNGAKVTTAKTFLPQPGDAATPTGATEQDSASKSAVEEKSAPEVDVDKEM